jgi:hypothetical protein
MCESTRLPWRAASARGVAMNPMAIEGLALIVGVLVVWFWSARDDTDD